MGFKRASESFAFQRNRIPAVWITTGPNPDHGTVDDTPEKIDPDRLESNARLAYGIIKTLANENESHPFAGR